MRHAASSEGFRQYGRGFNGIVCICLILIALSGCGESTTTYTIAYDDNVYGETIDVPPESAAFAEGTVMTLSDIVPERTGYAFAGWNTAPDGTGVAYAAGGLLIVGAADQTLYAQWATGATYAIFYEDNVDGELIGVPTASTGYAAGSMVALSSIVPERTGYAFAGWSTAPEGSGVTYAAGSLLIIGAADLTLYAQWTTGPTYTILYDGNVDGELIGVPTASTGYVSGTEVVLSSIVPERTGYAFAGWNTAPDGTGVVYAAGGTLIMASTDVTLYAQWTTGPTYRILYEDNVDGELIGVPSASTGYVAGSVVSLSSSVPERAGYTFTGWNTVRDGSGFAYAAGGMLTMGSGDVILHAQWTDVPVYSLTYHDNVDDETIGVPRDDGAYYQGTTVSISTAIPVRADYDFSGWNTLPDGTGGTYAPGASLVIGTADVTLYAQWVVALSVTYDANLPAGTSLDTGSAPIDDTLYDIGDSVTVAGDNGMTVSGYRFNGWNGQADGQGTAYSGSFTIADDITLYAQWLPLYTVTYDGNSNDTGTVPTDGNAYAAGESVTVSANDGSLVRSGYNFGGWNTAAGGGGTAYDATGSATFDMPASNLTLYARWLQIFGISYSDASGESSNLPQNGTYVENDASFTISTAVPVRDGYVFDGWYTDAGFGGTRYMPGDVYTINSDGDVGFYADWVQAGTLTATPSALGANYTVSFDDNDGNGTTQIPSQTVAVGDTAVPPNQPVRAEFGFAGWYSDRALTRAYDFDTAVTGDITLYARWVSLSVSYTVSFEGGIYPSQTVFAGASAVDPGPLPDGTDISGDTLYFIQWIDLRESEITPFDFNAPITADLTIGSLRAYDPAYTVSFDDNDGNAASNQVGNQRIIEGNAAAEPAAPPILAGADFAGWYGDPGLTTSYDFNTAVTGDITLYARWIDRWTEGDLATSIDNTDWYYFDATAGREYELAWDDSADGSFTYGGDVRVTAYRGDLASTVFAAVDNGYAANAQHFVASVDERIYLRVEVNSGSAGTYALRFTRKYEAGDTGPGGGLIFYIDDGTYGMDGAGNTIWTYLEAAPARYDSRHVWGPYQLGSGPAATRGIAIPGSNRTALGTGYDNTLDFIASQNAGPQVDGRFESDPIYYAAQRAASLSIFSGATGLLFDDWFLPASDTLREMYGNLYLPDYDNDGAPDNVGEFFDGPDASFYWASTEDVDVWCDASCSFFYYYYVNRAWSLDVGGNGLVDVGEQKEAYHYVRAVRRF